MCTWERVASKTRKIYQMVLHLKEIKTIEMNLFLQAILRTYVF